MKQSMLALILVWCVGGCSGSPTPGAGPTSTSSSSTTAPTTTSTTDDDVGEGPGFAITPSRAGAGESVVVSGSGCPPETGWSEGSGFDFFVVVGATVDGHVREAATVHPPNDDPGHVSFELVPEYDEQRVADATPDAAGDWSATWEIPADAATGEVVVSALCIGGPGLEAGYVHYGGILLEVQGSGDCPRPRSSPAVFDDDTGTYAATILAFDGSTSRLEFDVVQWLSGQDADDAWHEEYPDDPDGPPNDYFILNDNPLVREASVAEGADVRLVRLETDGSADVTAGTLAEFPAYLATTQLSTYWLTFDAGVVTAICEQYRP